MNEKERTEVLAERKGRRLPQHSPPHLEFTDTLLLLLPPPALNTKTLSEKVPKEWQTLKVKY